MKTTQEMIEVMQAFADGTPVEVRVEKDWRSAPSPYWNWRDNDYRIATTPDTINWDHVAPEYKWMARDEDGVVYVFTKEPKFDYYCLSTDGDCAGVTAFTSYKRGTVDWRDSLVQRPA